MGLVLENIKYKEYLNDISCVFLDGSINGIYGDHSKYIIDIINGDISDYDGTLKYDDNIMDVDYYKLNSTVVALIEDKPFFYTDSVYDEFRFNLDFRNCDIDILENKSKELLNLVGLDVDILNRNIHTLSSSEKYLLSIAVNLIYDPDIVLFKDVFVGEVWVSSGQSNAQLPMSRMYFHIEKNLNFLQTKIFELLQFQLLMLLMAKKILWKILSGIVLVQSILQIWLEQVTFLQKNSKAI